jgi:hypothetical protein
MIGRFITVDSLKQNELGVPLAQRNGRSGGSSPKRFLGKRVFANEEHLV